MNELKMPVVTEDDVLAGEKEITVERREGGVVKVKVKAMSWRTALINAEATLPGQGTAETLRNCLNKEQSKDAFLDTIIPAHLYWIVTTAANLSNGVAEIKKKMSAAAVAPALPTTSAASAS